MPLIFFLDNHGFSISRYTLAKRRASSIVMTTPQLTPSPSTNEPNSEQKEKTEVMIETNELNTMTRDSKGDTEKQRTKDVTTKSNGIHTPKKGTKFLSKDSVDQETQETKEEQGKGGIEDVDLLEREA
eukprot:TRINITY_DN11313_c1_g2_i1.p1 TRINITY_DN11313_c1_g2~~TRINITY_DN11313_c1_g2_i1.p1  ORF type:complete len:128 (-),score=25.32 TRINITY_DN11313_c1_g2_i1:226-609(-)